MRDIKRRGEGQEGKTTIIEKEGMEDKQVRSGRGGQKNIGEDGDDERREDKG